MADGSQTLSERDRKVIDATLNSTGASVNDGWGWRIPRNPDRVMAEFTEAEQEVKRMVENGTG